MVEGEINCGRIYKYTHGLPQPPVTGLDEFSSEEELYGTDEEAGEVEGEGEGAHGDGDLDSAVQTPEHRAVLHNTW